MYALTIVLLTLAGIAALYLVPRMVRTTPPVHSFAPVEIPDLDAYAMPADVKRTLHTLEAHMVDVSL